MKTNISRLIIAVSFLVAVSAKGQGFILPRGELQTPKLMSHKVDADISNQVAEVKAQQIFKNESSVPVEGVYYFPIPKEASVSDFAMWVDGKKLEGELLSHDEARKIYEDIVRRNIDPALLEYADYRFFRVNIFPIPPGKERKIELKYAQFLTMDGGLVRFIYPLHGQTQLGRTAGRPIPPITPLPPHPRLPHPQQFPAPTPEERSEQKSSHEDCRQTFVMNIDSDVPIKNVYSPSHEVEISRQSDHRVRVSYEGNRVIDEGDFLLYYSVSPEDLGLSLVCHQTSRDDGFFLLLVSPKTKLEDEEILDKDIIFVLDTSGSMAGEKIEQAKGALEYCINRLRPDDRFALITFSSEVHKFQDKLVSGRLAKRQSLEFVRSIKAKGGTNIDAALKEALSFQHDTDRPMNIVFLTDGLPTVGATDVKTILANVGEKNKGVRIFSFGVGYDVNTFLLDKIAERRRGVSDYIAPDEDIEEKISLFFDKVSTPVLSDLELDYSHISVSDVFPKQLPDLFQGSQLMVVGRYGDSGETIITLTGRTTKKRKDFVYETEFSNEAENDFLPRLWASRKIAYLVDEMRTHGENDEVRQEIEDLSKEYGIMSPYTSYLVQEDQAQIVALRAQSGSFGVTDKKGSGFHVLGGTPQPAESFDALSSVGRAAVEASKSMRKMKEAVRIVETKKSDVRYVGGRTFYYRDGEWVDSQYKDEKVVEIKHGSTAFVNLLLCYPEIGKFMKLGNCVVVKLNKKFVRIGERGKEDTSQQKLCKIFG